MTDNSTDMHRKHSVGRLAALLAVAALIPLCIVAGVWQLDRAAQKERHVARMQARSELPPVVVTGEGQWSSDLLHRSVTARGTPEPEHRIRVRRRGADGTAGFDLFEPLRLENSETRLLVNRGWRPEMERDGAEGSSDNGLREVIGLIAAPALPPLRLDGGADFGQMEYWPWLDPEEFARLHGVPTRPFILVADPREIARLRTARQGDSGMHIGYAIQWFAFAAMALVLTVLMLAPRWGRRQ